MGIERLVPSSTECGMVEGVVEARLFGCVT
jgi:hypothetical protein